MDRFKLRDDGVEWRELDGEIVAIDFGNSEYLSVNETGVAIWRALVAGATRDQLVTQLADAHDLEPDEAARDLDEFIGQLDERDLLER